MASASPTMFYDSTSIAAGNGSPGNLNLLTFTPEYFAGADISIYIGDQFFDEVVSLQFGMVQQNQPVFSYASYTYDALAIGTRNIQGTFSINFRDPLYIDNKLALNANASVIQDSVFTYNNTLLGSLQSNSIICTKYPDLVGATTIPTDVMLAIATGTDDDINNIVNGLTAYNWNSSDESTLLDTQHMLPFLNQTFDIVIAYGEIPHVNDYNTTLGGSYDSSMGTINTAFNLLSNLGPAIMLSQVQITGVFQNTSIEDDGLNLLEAYNFVAKDLIKQPTVGTSS
jgi:hypothetical protein